jgi:hypothetical protein
MRTTEKLRDVVIWCNTVRVDIRIGHGMVQEVNCKLLNAVVGVRYQAYLCVVCDEVATRETFLLSLGSPQSLRLHPYSILLFHSYITDPI